MCRRTTCSRCHRPSWSGCGAHVEQVLGDVPEADRCRCGARSAKAAPAASKTGAAAGARSDNWFKRLIGR